jgi:microcystin degradation protein MlrC
VWAKRRLVVLVCVRAQRGPVLLVEPSDNIGGGAPGDATSLLRHLLDKSYGSAEDWTSWKASVVINDSSAAAELMANSDLPIGGTATLSSLGGRGSALSAAPIESLRVELLARSDGEFDLENPNSHLASMVGLHISVRKTQLLSHSIVMMIVLPRQARDKHRESTQEEVRFSQMGPTVLVRCADRPSLRVLITSAKTAPFDLGQLRSQGIVPEEEDLICVKAAVAHRAAYDPIAYASFTVSTPGPCGSDLRDMPYRHVRRPIYPLDPL